MSIATFIPEVWSRRLLTALRRAHVYGMLVNRDYEGEIAAAGDTVRINTVGDPTVDDYVPNVTEVEPEELSTAQQSLLVDQAKYFAFKVDDVDARQAAGNLIPEGMSNAGFRLRDTSDAFLELLIRTGVQASNVLTPVDDALSADAEVFYDTLVDLGTVLTENDVPTEGRWAVCPAWVYGFLLKDPRFVSFATSDSAATRANGRVGMAAGFDIHVSNNNPEHTTGFYPVHAGHNIAVSFAEQVPSNTTEAYRPEKGFSDAVKGLHVYGAKVVRPQSLATVDFERTTTG